MLVLAAMVCGTLWMVRSFSPDPARPAAARKAPVPRPEAPAAKPKKAADAPAPAAVAAPAPAKAPPAAPGAGEKPPQAPLHEVFPRHREEPDNGTLHAALPPPAPPLPPAKKLPRVAIIIDDLGYDRHLAEKLIQLKAPLTLAILPFSPHRETISRLAEAHQLETLLHLPMEPMEYPDINPGPGALLAGMSADDLLRTLEANLDALPGIKGVNNHMGSRLTAQSEAMYQVFSVLKKRGLFFVDSRTTETSICRPSARLLQLPFAQRDVFLDHSTDPVSIRRQVRLLLRIAYRKGEAVGIGHPNPATLAVLRETLPELREQLEIVPVSQLVRIPEG
jgi:hypothetical protein